MWISETMYRLVDNRLSACQDPAMDQSLIPRLRHVITAILKGYHRRREKEAGRGVERLLGSNPPLHWETWHCMKGWYQAVVDRAPLPDRVTLEGIAAKQVDLYSYLPPQGIIFLYMLSPSCWTTW